MELEKKRMRPIKRTFKGPYILYHSTVMPVMSRAGKGRSTNASSNTTTEPNDVKGKCARTFISFENDINDTAFQKVFKTKTVKRKPSYICPITK